MAASELTNVTAVKSANVKCDLMFTYAKTNRTAAETNDAKINRLFEAPRDATGSCPPHPNQAFHFDHHVLIHQPAYFRFCEKPE